MEQNQAEAVKWYLKSAEQGIARAQTLLGMKYAAGEGIEKDYVSAHAWFSLGAANEDENAVEFRVTLEKHMSSQQITNAQKRTEELRKVITDKQGE